MTPEQVDVAIQHAEAAVRNGFLVFPVVMAGGTKKPMETGWQTKVWDLGVMAAAMRQRPNVIGYGITLPKDDPRRIVDLDIDDGQAGPGDGPTWQERLAAVEAEFGALPETKVTVTPSGGIHRWYLWPVDVEIPRKAWHGFTVRCLHGGRNFVVGPGSVRADGAAYVNASPGTSIATMPGELARSGMPSKATAQDGGTITFGGYQLPDSIPAGDCYTEMLGYTLHLWNHYCTPEEMWALVREVYAPRMVKPHDLEHLRRHFDDATRDLGRFEPSSAPREASPEQDEGAPGFAEPEDRGRAVLSPTGDREYVEDLAHPGRIVVVPAEEGTGKTVAILGELAIRFAVAGGSFAETWPILECGNVLVLSEQHPDDDHRNETRVLDALGHTRSELEGRYWRLSTMTAAGERPPLMDAEWRSWAIDWMRAHDVRMLIVDTATGATQVDPWGKDMQTVYRALRGMVEDLPELVIVLLMHLKKPTGRGERRISDVLGEWGRWCDVVLLMEGDGDGRVRLSTRKRVQQQRRILATQRDFLLVDPIDLTQAGSVTKVAPAAVLAAVEARPGINYAELGEALEVSKDTARRYVQGLGDAVIVIPGTNKSPAKVYPKGAAEGDPTADAPKPRAAPPTAATHSDARAHAVPPAVPAASLDGASDAAPHAPYRGAAGDAAPPPTPEPADLVAAAVSAFGGDLIPWPVDDRGAVRESEESVA